ncbi:MAG: DUF6446 family protein [Pseudomonadota bacterium]
MSGKLIGIVLVVLGAAAGVGMYYLQVYHFYDRLDPGAVALTVEEAGALRALEAGSLSAIDATSSPIRFRACFELTGEVAGDPYPGAVPLNAPGWFDCFDAAAIGADLESGTAIAVTGQRNIVYGIDRVLAIYPDGRGFAWHQINACGEEVFDGRPAPEGCPPPPEGNS